MNSDSIQSQVVPSICIKSKILSWCKPFKLNVQKADSEIRLSEVQFCHAPFLVCRKRRGHSLSRAYIALHIILDSRKLVDSYRNWNWYDSKVLTFRPVCVKNSVMTRWKVTSSRPFPTFVKCPNVSDIRKVSEIVIGWYTVNINKFLKLCIYF